MKSFFQGFNFARLIILVCALGAAPLGWRVWQQYEYNQTLRAALAEGGEVEVLARRVLSNARVYTKLKKEERDDALFGGEQSDVQIYIRRHASADRVEIGQVNVVPRDTTGRSFIDHKLTISPFDPERSFSRTQIANFLFKLEDESSRVKVTDIDIRNEERRLDDSDIPPDRWTFKAVITTREKIE